LVATNSAFAGAHTWRISEIFTNSTGTIQFVELFCISGASENFVGGLQVTTGTNTFTFPGNLAGSTLNKRILLGTAAYAALPGAPTPDYTIPSNFFATGGGFTIRYNPGGNYDSNVVGAGIIPTNGINSLTWTTFNGGNTADTFVTNQPNSPQNFNGGTGSVVAGCPDQDGDGYGNPGNSFCSGGTQTDCNDGNPSINPGATEASNGECSDAADNDCDSLTDCLDAGCGTAAPACVPTVSEWGLVALAVLTLTAGSIMLRQRM
jgi:hypothetical protein